MKKLILSLFCVLCLIGAAQAQVTKSVTTTKGGELASRFASDDEIATMEVLTVSGVLNAKDFVTIKKMRQLTSLDITNVRISPYGGEEGSAGESVREYPADELPASALNGLTFLTEVKLPTSIKGLGSASLPKSLTSIELYEGLQYIGASALASTKITEVTLPSTLKTIGASAFASTGITEIVIPAKVTEIGGAAFSSCVDFSYIELPKTEITFGINVFKGTTSLTDFSIPEYWTEIPAGTFSGSGLTNITIPAAITSIGNEAFKDCKSLDEVVFEGNPAVYGTAVFSGAGLESIDLPVGITKITQNMFYGCTYLSSITLPATVDSIMPAAFRTSGLESITIPAAVKFIGGGSNLGAFDGCASLTTVTFEQGALPEMGAQVFRNCTMLAGISLPEGITSVPANAFRGCSGLTSVTLPASIKSIGLYAFQNTTALQSISFNEGLQSIATYAFSASGLTSVTLPNTVTTLGTYAFSDCPQLQSAVLSDNITELATGVFRNCAALTTVQLPVKLKTAGQWSFQGTKLSALHFPASLETIAWDVYNNCSELKTISLPAGITSLAGVNNAIPALEAVYVASSTPLPFASSTADYFKGSSAKVLYVPAGSKSAYEAGNVWNKFTEIREWDGGIKTAQNTVSLDAPAFSTTSLAVTYAGTWTASENADWLTVTKSGSNLTFRAESDNNTGAVRVAKLTFSADGIPSHVIAVEQKSINYLNLGATSLKIDSLGGSVTLQISSNVAWTANANRDWLTVTPSSGTGSATITLSAGKNLREGVAAAYTSGTVSFISGSISTTPTVSVSQPAVANFALAATTKYLNVATDYASTPTITFNTAISSIQPNNAELTCTVIEGADWITNVTRNAGNIVVSISANATGQHRSGKVKVSFRNDLIKDTIYFTQYGGIFLEATSPLTLNLPGAGGADSVYFNTNLVRGNVKTAYVDPDADWVAVGAAFGVSATNSVDKGARIYAFKNTTGAARSTQVKLFSRYEWDVSPDTLFVTINQPAFVAALSVESESLNFAAAGETKSLEVTANVVWSAALSEGADWLTLESAEGENNGSISLTAANNTNAVARTATLTITGEDGVTAAVTLTQEGTTGLRGIKNSAAFALQTNPVVNEARFSFESAGNGASIVIVDLAGKFVASESIAEGSTEAVVNVSGLPKGVYIVSYSDNAGKTGSLKLIK